MDGCMWVRLCVATHTTRCTTNARTHSSPGTYTLSTQAQTQTHQPLLPLLAIDLRAVLALLHCHCLDLPRVRLLYFPDLLGKLLAVVRQPVSHSFIHSLVGKDGPHAH